MDITNFTEGKILGPLMRFALPAAAALLLQSLYGAVDLLIVGRYASSADVSAVSTGAQIMQTIVSLIAGLAMGTTILLGQQIGENRTDRTGKTVGTSIVFFGAGSLILSVLMLANTEGTAVLMHAPAEAFSQTCDYIRICSGGLLFITAYNLLGSLFRGIGNSRIPLLAVMIAAAVNIAGDLLLVKGMHMGAAGAAAATVAAQLISVLVSLLFIRSVRLPFALKRSDLRFDGFLTRRILGFGIPIAVMDLLVGISFLVILAIVNSLGVLVSAGVGVAEKVCSFVMLVPSAFAQSIASFTAQNYGAAKMDRAYRGLAYGIAVSFVFGAAAAWLSFFHGDLLCGVFSTETDVVLMGWEYMKAYAIDCLLVSFFFCMTGFFNGCGYTRFVMIQGIVGAFLVRIPVSWFMARQVPVSLFHVGLATPASSFVQCIMCFAYLIYKRKKENLPA
ncbi:MAG: MATE family efflux transporter [Solobacterium sp.]|nr:MATE family efflux transporter [Solobacterium sp.]